MNEIKIYINKSNIQITLKLFIIIEILLILLIGILLIIPILKYSIILVILLLIFNTAISIKIFFNYKNNTELIIFNEKGIFTFGIIASKNFLDWNDIIKTQNINYRNIPMIGIKINPDSQFIKNRNLFGKLILKHNIKKTGYHLTFSYFLLDDKFDLINKFLKEHLNF